MTLGQWETVMGFNVTSAIGADDNCPVGRVTWDCAMEFCDKLNQKFSNNLPKGYKFSLPTEAQWEYACRAGTTTALNNGKNLTCEDKRCFNLDEVGWYDNNRYDNNHIYPCAHPVKQKQANSWGFYDMHGNVFEWCYDRYKADYGGKNKVISDPYGPKRGLKRVIRGGSVKENARNCRAAYRGSKVQTARDFFTGFRLSLVPILGNES